LQADRGRTQVEFAHRPDVVSMKPGGWAVKANSH
jgi:hypothetical protein